MAITGASNHDFKNLQTHYLRSITLTCIQKHHLIKLILYKYLRLQGPSIKYTEQFNMKNLHHGEPKNNIYLAI